MLGISTVGIVRCQKGRRWQHLGESLQKTYRSVLVSSWLSSNRASKTAAGGCDIHRRLRYVSTRTSTHLRCRNIILVNKENSTPRKGTTGARPRSPPADSGEASKVRYTRKQRTERCPSSCVTRKRLKTWSKTHFWSSDPTFTIIVHKLRTDDIFDERSLYINFVQKTFLTRATYFLKTFLGVLTGLYCDGVQVRVCIPLSSTSLHVSSRRRVLYLYLLLLYIYSILAELHADLSSGHASPLEVYVFVAVDERGEDRYVRRD